MTFKLPFHPETMAFFAILSHVAYIIYQLTFPRSSSEVTAKNPDLALIKGSAQVVHVAQHYGLVLDATYQQLVAALRVQAVPGAWWRWLQVPSSLPVLTSMLQLGKPALCSAAALGL